MGDRNVMYGNIRSDCCHSLCQYMRTKWPVILLIFSFTLMFLLVVFKWVALDYIVDQKIAEHVRLEPGSSTWNKWINITVPIFLKFYMFNVTNPLDIMKGAKPVLQETGPYVYEEKRLKTVLGFDAEKDTIVYSQHITYSFRPDLSKGSEKDRVILINVPFVSVAKLARQMTNISLAFGIADRSLRQRGERLFTYNTVREYLFDGWSVESYISFLSNPLIQLVGGTSIPKAFYGGKFGFYRGKNGSDDGEIVVRTGITNPKEFGRIMSWNGQTKLSHWAGTCNSINGTDGSILPPFITKTEVLRFFIPDLCRSLLMVYGHDSEVKGIKTYRFVLPEPKPIFESPEFCFCPKDKKLECYKSGVFSLSPCRENAPIAVSAPHFFQAWEPYQKGIKGLNPNRVDHDTYLDVEPKTGLIIRGVKRIQFNVKLEPNPHMTTFANVPNLLFPFMWAEEEATITDEILNDIRTNLYDSIDLAEQVSLGGLLGCSGLILLGIIGCFFVSCGHKETSRDDQIYSSRDKDGSISKDSLARSSSTGSMDKNPNSIAITDPSNGNYDPYAYLANEKEMTEKISHI